MLQPNTTVLVVIDKPTIGLLPPTQMIAALRRLWKAASIVSAPLIVTQYPKSEQPGILATACAPAARSDVQHFDPAPAAWPESPLGAQLAKSSRNQIVVSGILLEEAVTLLALNCLFVGYDTYIPIDAISAAEPAIEHAAWHRLTQAGVVPTSSHQIIREWAAFSTNADLQNALMTLLITPPSP